jgi:3-oxoacyl-[acyl-carrier protein] reductase
MELKLKGRVAIVTGASKGMGLSIVKALVSEGVSVLLISRNIENLNSVVNEIKLNGGDVEGFQGDVSDPFLADKSIQYALNKWNKVDILINNASGPVMGTFLQHSEEIWNSAIQTNLMSAIRFTKIVSPIMIKNNWGRIVSISSTLAKEPTSNMVLSATVRSGLSAFTKAVSSELAQYNITTNVICPGGVITERLHSLLQTRAENEKREYYELLKESQSSIPTKRFANPEEIADTVLFLVSEKSAYITGVSLVVDGGLIKSF